MRAILLLLLLLEVTNLQAQSKKELQEKYEQLQRQNLKLETSNTLLNTQVGMLTERIKHLEKELLIEKEAARSALVAKEAAEKSKEALFEEKSRMEEVFRREAKGKSSLRQMSIAGRYYREDNAAKEREYIELFEDGTLLTVLSKTEKNNLLESVTGTYKLKGSRITFILSIFTITKAVDGTINGNRLIFTEKGKNTVYVREN